MTHGGLLGTQEAIYYGIPLLGIPLFGDQQFNIDSYVNKGLALKLKLEDFNEEKLSKALREILQNPIYKYVYRVHIVGEEILQFLERFSV